MLFRNKERNENKCHKDKVADEVHALPGFQAWSKLKQHKSTAKILHGTIMEKPAEPVVEVTEFWRQVRLDGLLHSYLSHNGQRNTQECEIISRCDTMPEGAHKKGGEHSRIEDSKQ